VNDTVDTPREALIELIAATRDARSAEIIDEARQQARARIRNAFHEARQRVGRALDEERVRARGLLAVNEARLETHNRQRYQDVVQHMLARARHRLGAALLARWQDPRQRRQWLEHLLGQALARLPKAHWEIEHPAGWDSAEIAAWLERIGEHSGARPALKSTARIAAGLRIQAGGASLDGTLDGLLADERAVQAKLLAQLEAALPQTGSGEKS
jgi:vacuolar-type H+-ATPase subunit H